MMRAKKIGSKIITLFVVLCLLLSFFSFIVEADHDCQGEDCPICLIVNACLRLLKSLTLIFVFTFIYSTAASLFCDYKPLPIDSDLSDTLVSLKVKFSC